MAVFRAWLVLIWLGLVAYTAIVIEHHGMGLLAIFFGDMSTLGWPGQFNLDFMGMLTLSALWVSWRHRFSAAGLALGLVALFGGSLFLATYLLVLTSRPGIDGHRLLVGDRAA